MTADRVDLLLQRALAEGSIPPEASADEREEIERLLAASSTLSQARTATDSELAIAMPAARARFERFLAAGGGVDRVPDPAPHRGRVGAWLGGGFLGLPRLALAAAPVAAVLLVVAFVALRGSLGSVETAVALESGDYVQFEGTVDAVRPAGAELEVGVRSGAGHFVVHVPADATLRGTAGEELPAASLKPGAALVVDGLVREGNVEAITIALGAHRPEAPAKIVRVNDVRGPVSGQVLFIRLVENGSRGEVVVLMDDGRRVIVPVAGESVEGLLRRFTTAMGERIEVKAEAGGLFRLQAARGGDEEPAPTPAAGRPALPTSRGLVVSLSAERLEVRTLDGIVTAVVTPRTRFLASQSGLVAAEVRDGRATVGHTVAVTGHRDPLTGGLIADLVILGPRPRLPVR